MIEHCGLDDAKSVESPIESGHCTLQRWEQGPVETAPFRVFRVECMLDCPVQCRAHGRWGIFELFQGFAPHATDFTGPTRHECGLCALLGPLQVEALYIQSCRGPAFDLGDG